MESITEKALKEITQLEKTAVVGSKTNVGDNDKPDVEVQVDTSDESNMSENDNIFSTFNQASEVSSLKVDVQIDEDLAEDEDQDPSDAIAEGGEDTVFGQGSNPKPEDETYLNLLKKTVPEPKVKIKVDKR